MNAIRIPLITDRFEPGSPQATVLAQTEATRLEALAFMEEGRLHDAMDRTVEALKNLRNFPDYADTEFRALFAALLFDLAEIHFELKNFQQSEKELEVLFKLLDALVKLDGDRFGKFHILALELSARIVRSGKKALSLIVRHQLQASALYEKVNAGVAEAAGKLAATLAEIGRLLASTGKETQAVKFLAEAIKFSKRHNGKVTAGEIALTLEMAEIMSRTRADRAAAKRLLEAVLPKAIALGATDLERDILALIEFIEMDSDSEPAWKAFMSKVLDMAGTAKNKIMTVFPEKQRPGVTE